MTDIYFPLFLDARNSKSKVQIHCKDRDKFLGVIIYFQLYLQQVEGGSMWKIIPPKQISKV